MARIVARRRGDLVAEVAALGLAVALLLPLGIAIVMLLVARDWTVRILNLARDWLVLHARTVAAVIVVL